MEDIMNYIYTTKKSYKIEPFIITQVGDQQNEFVYASNNIMDNRSDFSQYLYTKLEFKKVTDSLMRCFTYKDKVVFVYYWECTINENISNRKGLYVLVGVCIPKKFFIKNFSNICYLINKYFSLLSIKFNIDFENSYSNKFFKLLQNDNNKSFTEINDILNMKSTLSPNKCIYNIKYHNIYNKTIMIFDDNFNNRVLIFNYEALLLIKSLRGDNFDISTNKYISQVTINFIKNRTLINENISNAAIRQIHKVKYLIMS